MPIVEVDPATPRPRPAEPEDFDAFWADTLAQTRSHPLDVTLRPHWVRALTVYDVSFRGFGGALVRAWLAMPTGADRPLPCVVEYPGYGGGRGLPHQCLLYAAAGHAHLFMDVRGQGSGWRTGDTPDSLNDGAAAPAHPGFMTRGILDPATYYYRRVIADAVRAVEAARACPLVDADRVAVTGISQGGGLALAVNALVPDLRAVCPDVPFLCDIRRGVDVAPAGPYPEVARYLAVHRDHAGPAFRTLSYVDGVTFAARGRAPALFSTALMDQSCPPSTVYAAFHAYCGPKDLAVYEFNGHEGGEAFHDARRLDFLDEVLRASRSDCAAPDSPAAAA